MSGATNGAIFPLDTGRLETFERLLTADVIEPALEGEAVEAGERQCEEKTDAAVEEEEGIAEGCGNVTGGVANRAGVGNTPVGSHRLTGPNRTNFFGGVITKSKDEIQFGSAGLGEFIPAFAAEVVGWEFGRFQLPKRTRIHKARGMAACAVSGENGLPFVLQNGFGHDGARRIARTKKQQVVVRGHKTAGSIRSRSGFGHRLRSGLHRTHKGAHDSAVDLRGDGIDIDPVA